MTAPKVKFAPEPEVSKCGLPAEYDVFVLVRFTVDTHGKPQGARILRSSNDPCVDKIALEAANQYKLVPARKDGQATPVEMVVEVNVRKF